LPSSSPGTTASPPRVLPADLTNAIKQLEDQELDRLLSAVLAERKRRGRKVSASDGINASARPTGAIDANPRSDQCALPLKQV